MTLADLRQIERRRFQLRAISSFAQWQCEQANALLAALIVSPRASFEAIYRDGFSGGFAWAKQHRLIVFHREVWQVSKLGREYLALLESPRLNLADVNSFLEKARAETLA